MCFVGTKPQFFKHLSDTSTTYKLPLSNSFCIESPSWEFCLQFNFPTFLHWVAHQFHLHCHFPTFCGDQAAPNFAVQRRMFRQVLHYWVWGRNTGVYFALSGIMLRKFSQSSSLLMPIGRQLWLTNARFTNTNSINTSFRWIAWRQPGTREVLLHGWTPVVFSFSNIVYHLMFTLVISFQIDIHVHIGIVFVLVIGCHGESMNHGINLQTYQFW